MGEKVAEKKKCIWCDGSGKEKENWAGKPNPKVGQPCSDCHGSGFELSSEDGPICPYCGYCDDGDAWELSGETDDRGHQCPECEKFYGYESYTTRTFQSKPIPCLNGAPHNWVKTGWSSYPNARRCKGCGWHQYTDAQLVETR